MTLRNAYLTIDDSPSERMDDMVDGLVARNVPAVFFCRGDQLEQYFNSAVRAIRNGFVLANHSYSHPRSSTVSFDAFTDEIRRTQQIIDRAYQQANVKLGGDGGDPKLFRFPHMDRGMGGWIIDYDRVSPDRRDQIIRMFADGLNVTLDPPDQAARDKCRQLQEFLTAEGFVRPAFHGVAFPWYVETEMADAVDAMFTYSTSDWMLTARHKGQWPWKTVDDLKSKMDQDISLQQTNSAHILLAHDQAEIHDETMALIDYGLATGIQFQPLGQRVQKL